MIKLSIDKSFHRAFKRLIKKNPQVQEKIFSIFTLLEEDPFTPSLKTHKLTGDLDGLWSCSVNYDCRIIFSLQKDKNTNEELITLIDIGSHDEVY